jgi:hypothetical protein
VTDALYLIGGLNLRYSEAIAQKEKRKHTHRPPETADQIKERMKRKIRAISGG